MAYRRFLCAFDLHGDQLDPASTNAFLRFDREFKAQDRIVGGDIWDMRPFRGKASAEEKRESIKADFDAGFGFLEGFRPSAVLLGNHDRRLWDFAARSDGPICDLARELVGRVDRLAGNLRARVLPYHKRDGVLSLGRLNVLHGFFAGEGAARKHAAIYGPCIHGHIHAFDHASTPGIGGNREAWSSPCLCKKDLDYNSATPSTLRYDNGWAYGVYSDDHYEVFIARVVRGKVVVTSGVKVLSV